MFARFYTIFCFCVALLGGAVGTYGQPNTDTIKDKRTLKEATVNGEQTGNKDLKIKDFSPGQKLTAIDTVTLQQYRMQSIGSLLTQQVPVFVKSYGFNGLATLSFRGASAAQSQVLWNGVPIQNAALGIADVSTLPVMFMNTVDIIYGGSSALTGSGNVGGALLLGDESFSYAKKPYCVLSLSGSTGSFGQLATGGDIVASWKKWNVSAKILLQSASNNFGYKDENGKKVTADNSHLQGSAVTVRVSHLVKKVGNINFMAWWQQYNREIPPALFEQHSYKKQIDGSLKLLANWATTFTNRNRLYARTSFIRDNIDYSDQALLLNSNAVTYQYFHEVGCEWLLGKHGRLLLFTPLQISWLTGAQTTGAKQQNKIALAGAYDLKLLDNKLNAAVNVRLESVDSTGFSLGKAQRFLLPGASASYKLTQWLSLRANVQRTYRLPTLNELYYYPGGNAALKPEYGWNEDAGYTAAFTYKNFKVYHDLSVFNRNIHDWIIWLGGAIWTPHNIAEVHSRGVETENRVEYTTGKWKLHLKVNTAYVLSTTVSSYIYNDGSVGKQIPYAPRYNGQLNVGFTYKQLYFNYNHTYTGYRFTVADESVYLPPFRTGNVQLMYNTSIRRHQIQLTAQCNNIWSERYNVVFSRPMPGVNFLAGFRVGVL
ncbi:hypothetical protein CJD36_004925 [Flavipsychrobacter stenotrophus]|uniref:TonB-dependent receptor plug domain-containing protein n=1 Tax=Flavipsychrobacter stenotrophus TaxID=2077091 RepID=A0A2S7T1L5_9BACT|nr:TonB-dependent receptor [Flavipsychrobacter stenotrophus]PQJ13090.1 hypothetical protein CJD36_004925 [Flavipsychrobacter stenotrophus]